jgi:hypothetical protein
MRRFGNPVFPADRFDGAAALHLFQNLDDLTFAVACFLHPSFSLWA